MWKTVLLSKEIMETNYERKKKKRESSLIDMFSQLFWCRQ